MAKALNIVKELQLIVLEDIGTILVAAKLP